MAPEMVKLIGLSEEYDASSICRFFKNLVKEKHVHLVVDPSTLGCSGEAFVEVPQEVEKFDLLHFDSQFHIEVVPGSAEVS